MKPRLVTPLLLLLAVAATADDALLQRARRLLGKSPLIDGHNDLPWAIRENPKAPHDVAAYDLRSATPGHTDLARLRKGLVGAQFWSVYIPVEGKTPGYARTQLEQIDIARQVVARYPDQLALALSAADIEKSFKGHRVASLIGVEGGHAIENSLGALRAYYDLGVRYMTLTHTGTLDWADAAGAEARHGGLTRFGEEVVREMNRLGMLVDLSHVTDETMEDALRVSEAPVIFSHSSARALCDVPRNVPDPVLKLLPKNGGVVMVTFVPSFVSFDVSRAYRARSEAMKAEIGEIQDPVERQRREREYRLAHPLPKATLSQVADHVDHIRKVAGPDHVGIGSDFDGIDEGPEGLEDVSKFPNLFAELMRRGWSDADLRKLAGGNLLRVLREAEAVSRRLRATRPASTATIEALDGTGPAK